MSEAPPRSARGPRRGPSSEDAGRAARSTPSSMRRSTSGASITTPRRRVSHDTLSASQRSGGIRHSNSDDASNSSGQVTGEGRAKMPFVPPVAVKRASSMDRLGSGGGGRVSPTSARQPGRSPQRGARRSPTPDIQETPRSKPRQLAPIAVPVKPSATSQLNGAEGQAEKTTPPGWEDAVKVNDSVKANVRVVCRFRPLNKREKGLGGNDGDCIQIEGDKSVAVQGVQGSYTFNAVLGSESTQQDVFNATAKDPVIDLFKGFHTTVFAYGQTGAGKSWTMMGDLNNMQNRGLTPRCTSAIFDVIQSFNYGIEYTIGCSYLQVYMEKVSDLLDPSRQNLSIRESPSKGVFVDGLSVEYVTSEDDVFELMCVGDMNKVFASTNMNATSSRSHCCFILNITQRDGEGRTKSSKLNLVDLAGSERISKTGAEGTTLDEAKKINLSLSCLSQCINKLSEGAGGHVPFRSSSLTRLLQDSLGGNCKTSVIIACSPHADNLEETISTLRFGERCCKVKCDAKANVKLSVEQLESMVKQLQLSLSQQQQSATNMARKERGEVYQSNVSTQFPETDAESGSSRAMNKLLTKNRAFVTTTVRLRAYSVETFDAAARAQFAVAIARHMNARLGGSGDNPSEITEQHVTVLEVLPVEGVTLKFRVELDHDLAVEASMVLSMALSFGDDSEYGINAELNAVGIITIPPIELVSDPKPEFSIDTGDFRSEVDFLYTSLMEKQVAMDALKSKVSSYRNKLRKQKSQIEAKQTNIDALQSRLRAQNEELLLKAAQGDVSSIAAAAAAAASAKEPDRDSASGAVEGSAPGASSLTVGDPVGSRHIPLSVRNKAKHLSMNLSSSHLASAFSEMAREGQIVTGRQASRRASDGARSSSLPDVAEVDEQDEGGEDDLLAPIITITAESEGGAKRRLSRRRQSGVAEAAVAMLTEQRKIENDELETLRKTVESLRADLRTVEADKKEFAERTEATEAAMSKLQSHSEELAKALEDMKQQRDFASEQMEELVVQHALEREELTAAVVAARSDADVRCQEAARAVEQANKAEADIESLNEAISSAEDRVSQAEREVGRANERADQAESQAQSHEQAAQQAAENADAARAEAQIFKASVLNAETKLLAVEKEKDDAVAESHRAIEAACRAKDEAERREHVAREEALAANTRAAAADEARSKSEMARAEAEDMLAKERLEASTHRSKALEAKSELLEARAEYEAARTHAEALEAKLAEAHSTIVVEQERGTEATRAEAERAEKAEERARRAENDRAAHVAAAETRAKELAAALQATQVEADALRGAGVADKSAVAMAVASRDAALEETRTLKVELAKISAERETLRSSGDEARAEASSLRKELDAARMAHAREAEASAARSAEALRRSEADAATAAERVRAETAMRAAEREDANARQSEAANEIARLKAKLEEVQGVKTAADEAAAKARSELDETKRGAADTRARCEAADRALREARSDAEILEGELRAEIARLQDEIGGLEEDKVALQDAKDALEAAEEMKRELGIGMMASLREQLDEEESANESLRQELEKAQMDVAETRGKLVSECELSASLQRDVKVANKRSSDLEVRLGDTEDSINVLREELESKSMELEAETKRTATLRAEVEGLRSAQAGAIGEAETALAEAQGLAAGLSTELKAACTGRDAAETERAAVKLRLSEVEAEARSAREAAAQLTGEKKGLENLVEREREERAQLMRQLETSMEHHRNEREDQRARYDEREEKLEARIQELEDAASTAASAFASERERAATDLVAAQTEARDKATVLSAAQTRARALEEELSAVLARADAAESEVTRIADEVKVIEAARDEACVARAATETELDRERHEARKAANDALEAVASSRRRVEDLTSELAELREEAARSAASAEAEVAALRDQVQEWSTKHAADAAAHEEATAGLMSQLKEERELRAEAVNKVTELRSKATAELVDFQGKIASLDAERQASEETLVGAIAERDEAVANVLSLKEQVSTLEAAVTAGKEEALAAERRVEVIKVKLAEGRTAMAAARDEAMEASTRAEAVALAELEARAELVATTERLENAVAEVANLNHQLGEMARRAQTEREAHAEAVQAQKEAMIFVREGNERLSVDLESARSELERERSSRQAAEKMERTVQDKLERLEGHAASVEAALRDADEATESLRKARDAAEAAAAAARAGAKAAEAERVAAVEMAEHGGQVAAKAKARLDEVISLQGKRSAEWAETRKQFTEKAEIAANALREKDEAAATLARQLEESTLLIATLRREAGDFGRRLGEVEISRNVAVQRVEQVEIALDVERQDANKLRGRLEAMTEELAALNQRMNVKEREHLDEVSRCLVDIARLTEELERARLGLGDAGTDGFTNANEARMAELEAENDQLDELATHLEAQVKEHTDLVERLQVSLSNVEQAKSEAEADHQIEIARLNNTIDQLEKAVNDLKARETEQRHARGPSKVIKRPLTGDSNEERAGVFSFFGRLFGRGREDGRVDKEDEAGFFSRLADALTFFGDKEANDGYGDNTTTGTVDASTGQSSRDDTESPPPPPDAPSIDVMIQSPATASAAAVAERHEATVRVRSTIAPKDVLSGSGPPQTERSDVDGKESGKLLQVLTLGLVKRGGGSAPNTPSTVTPSSLPTNISTAKTDEDSDEDVEEPEVEASTLGVRSSNSDGRAYAGRVGAGSPDDVERRRRRGLSRVPVSDEGTDAQGRDEVMMNPVMNVLTLGLAGRAVDRRQSMPVNSTARGRGRRQSAFTPRRSPRAPQSARTQMGPRRISAPIVAGHPNVAGWDANVGIGRGAGRGRYSGMGYKGNRLVMTPRQEVGNASLTEAGGSSDQAPNATDIIGDGSVPDDGDASDPVVDKHMSLPVGSSGGSFDGVSESQN